MPGGPAAETTAAASDAKPTIDVDVDIDVFERRFLAHATSQLPGRDDAWLADLARRSLEFGAVRAPEETLLRVGDLDDDTTAVDIVTRDAPYLVDSLRAELERRGCPADHVLHPQMVVRRDDSDRLQEIVDIDDNATVPDGATVESWMHVELDAVPAEDHSKLGGELRKVLADVHHAVDDAPAMYWRV